MLRNVRQLVDYTGVAKLFKDSDDDDGEADLEMQAGDALALRISDLESDDDDDAADVAPNRRRQWRIDIDTIERDVRDCDNAAIVIESGESSPFAVLHIPFDYDTLTRQMTLRPSVEQLPVAPVVALYVGDDNPCFVHTNREQRLYRAAWRLGSDTVVGMTLRADSTDTMMCASREAIVPMPASSFFDEVLASVAETRACYSSDSRPAGVSDVSYEWWDRTFVCAVVLVEYANYNPDDRVDVHDCIIDHCHTHYRLPAELASRVREWSHAQHRPIDLGRDLSLTLTYIDETELREGHADVVSGNLLVYYAMPTMGQ